MGKKFSFDFIPYTFDQLREMSMQELQMNIRRFKRMIREADQSGVETLPFETEFCYLEHERQMREKFEKKSRSRRNR